MSKKEYPSEIDKNVSEYDRFYGAQDFNPATRNVKLPVEIKHSYYNHSFIYQDIEKGNGADLETINVDGKIPALIIGSGPTFDEFAPLLKEWKGAVFVSTSQAGTCVYWEHPPEYIVALDPHTDKAELDCVDNWQKYDTKLICHPCINPVVIQEWPNKRLYYRPMEPSSDFHAMHLGIAYGSFIRTYCLLFSCTPAAQMAIAKKMGYGPLFFVGLDFGFPNYKRRMTVWYYNELEGWLSEQPSPVDKFDDDFKTENKFKRLVYAENGCCSSVMHLYYKRAILCVANIDMTDIFKVKAFNALTEFPEITKEELIETQGKLPKDRFYSNKKKQKIYEDYLARFYTFALRYKDGSLTYFECSPHIERYRDSLPGPLQEKVDKGEEVTIEQQIEIFLNNNFARLMQAKSKNPKMKDPKEYLNVKEEINRLKEIYRRAKAYREKILEKHK